VDVLLVQWRQIRSAVNAESHEGLNVTEIKGEIVPDVYLKKPVWPQQGRQREEVK